MSSVRCSLHLWYAPLAEGLLQSNADTPPDAVPKKRGPKTDVLEALLKRVDGLEKRLHSEGKSDELVEELTSAIHDAADSSKPNKTSPNAQQAVDRAQNHSHAGIGNQLMSPIEPRCVAATALHELTPRTKNLKYTNTGACTRSITRHLLCQNTWKAIPHPRRSNDTAAVTS